MCIICLTVQVGREQVIKFVASNGYQGDQSWNGISSLYLLIQVIVQKNITRLLIVPLIVFFAYVLLKAGLKMMASLYSLVINKMADLMPLLFY